MSDHYPGYYSTDQAADRLSWLICPVEPQKCRYFIWPVNILMIVIPNLWPDRFFHFQERFEIKKLASKKKQNWTWWFMLSFLLVYIMVMLTGHHNQKSSVIFRLYTSLQRGSWLETSRRAHMMPVLLSCCWLPVHFRTEIWLSRLSICFSAIKTRVNLLNPQIIQPEAVPALPVLLMLISSKSNQRLIHTRF